MAFITLVVPTTEKPLTVTPLLLKVALAPLSLSGALISTSRAHVPNISTEFTAPAAKLLAENLIGVQYSHQHVDHQFDNKIFDLSPLVLLLS